MAKVVKAGLVSSSWDQGPDQGDGDQLHRLVRRAAGQPQAHHHLGRPREVRRQGHHAQRLQLGQRQVEPHGGLRRPDRARARPRRRRRPTCPNCSSNAVAQPSSASAALQTFLSGQGDVLLDYEDDALYAKTKGESVDIITPPQTHPDPEPDRGDQDGQPGGQGLPGLPALARRPDDVGPAGLPARPAHGGGEVQLPPAQVAVHHLPPRRMDLGQHEVLRPHRRASWPRTSSRSASPRPAR